MSRTLVAAAMLLGMNLGGTAGRASAAEPSPARQPNIVVVLCDDLGYGDLGCYGHPIIKTPHLDALAAGGMRLTSMYSAAPVCSPSRVGLLTGRSPNRARVFDWIPEAKQPQTDAREQVHLRRGEVTIPMLLKQAAYATCMAGKWHCNSRFNDAAQPQPGDFGFDHWLATQNNAAPSHEQPVNFVRNGEPVGKVAAFSCQYVVSEAIGWLERLDDSRPFFLYVPFHEPHEPVASPEQLVAEYLPRAENRDQAEYFANVANLDAAVGRLVAALKRLDQRENTLIVFSSDNGPETLNRYRRANRSYGSPGPLRGMKLHTTEAGFRVAGILNWPGRITPGQTVDTAVSSLDLLPTFCQLTGSEPPAGRTLDGTDVSPLIVGKKFDRAKPLVWCYYNATNQQRVALRTGAYKVLAALNGADGSRLPKLQNITTKTLPALHDAKLTDIEIYDVTRDMGEARNFAAADPALTARLTAEIEAAYRELLDDSHIWEVNDL